MKIDLTTLQQKLANGDFVGFALLEDALAGNNGRCAMDKTSNVKLGAAKLAPTKLGGVKSGLSRA